jgi:outer membrane lipoprotein SlyB
MMSGGTRDASQSVMSFVKTCAAVMVATAICATSCATTATYSTESTMPDDYSPRSGSVESVREIVRRVQGNPAGGAVAGGLIGAVLFGGRGPRTLFGALAGAATGAALSQGSYETRAFEVTIRFDNGSRGVFTYRDYAPFRPGDRIELTPDGPRRVVY